MNLGWKPYRMRYQNIPGDGILNDVEALQKYKPRNCTAALVLRCQCASSFRASWAWILTAHPRGVQHKTLPYRSDIRHEHCKYPKLRWYVREKVMERRQLRIGGVCLYVAITYIMVGFFRVRACAGQLILLHLQNLARLWPEARLDRIRKHLVRFVSRKSRILTDSQVGRELLSDGGIQETVMAQIHSDYGSRRVPVTGRECGADGLFFHRLTTTFGNTPEYSQTLLDPNKLRLTRLRRGGALAGARLTAGSRLRNLSALS